MTLRRRHLVLALPAAWALSAAGCAEAPLRPAHQYTETISSLLISNDFKSVVIIGEHYHYIFTAPLHLVEALSSPLHAELSGSFSTFRVEKNGHISGQFDLNLNPALTPEQQAQATQLGFAPDADGKLKLHGELSGKRYPQGTLKAGRHTQALNQSYTIDISVDESRGDAVADDLLSPITAGSDGVLLLYYAALAPILIPVAILSKAPKN
ncbi:MAG: hypothetical protein JOY60_01465 [Burkholderiaceae bacterium]|nr:hypothetical protein [Roseateles sp.]MBV8468519.1 hypothetical protein [Burkholderiaceae bacterium]